MCDKDLQFEIFTMKLGGYDNKLFVIKTRVKVSSDQPFKAAKLSHCFLLFLCSLVKMIEVARPLLQQVQNHVVTSGS